MNSKIILASASPRRRELLEQIGLKFSVVPSMSEEKHTSDIPAVLVCDLSAQKALDVHQMFPGVIVIGADTVVAAPNGEILGKPKNEEDARRMMHLLSGQTHEVFTGVTVIFDDGDAVTECCRSSVTFRELKDEEIDFYLATGEYADKAGGYAIQGRAAVFVKKIEGCYSNIVGLPLPTLYGIFEHKGVNLWEQTISE